MQERNIKRFSSSMGMQKITKWIRRQKEGLFIVGLDIHVGFIIFKNGKISICHSSYYDPPLKVVNENIKNHSPLTDSKYRVLGKILDNQMMKKWLNKKFFTLKYDYFRNH